MAHFLWISGMDLFLKMILIDIVNKWPENGMWQFQRETWKTSLRGGCAALIWELLVLYLLVNVRYWGLLIHKLLH